MGFKGTLLVIALLSCLNYSFAQKIDANKVKRIEIHHTGFVMMSEMPTTDTGIFYAIHQCGGLDTNIFTTRKDILKITKLINPIVNTKNYYGKYNTFDAQGKVYVTYKNGKQDVIWITYDTDIIFNGQYYMLTSRRLNECLEDLYFKKHVPSGAKK